MQLMNESMSDSLHINRETQNGRLKGWGGPKYVQMHAEFVCTNGQRTSGIMTSSSSATYFLVSSWTSFKHFLRHQVLLNTLQPRYDPSGGGPFAGIRVPHVLNHLHSNVLRLVVVDARQRWRGLGEGRWIDSYCEEQGARYTLDSSKYVFYIRSPPKTYDQPRHNY